jgi:hypothetical protein
MNVALRYTVAAAVVVTLSIVGIGLFGGRPDPGSGGPAASATPTSPPTPSPTPSPSAGAEAHAFNIAVGPWRLNGTAPATFTTFDQLALWDGTAEPPAGHGIAFWTIGNVYRDPCASETTAMEPPLGPSVDDFVDALVSRVGGVAGPIEPVTVGGFAGRRVTIQVPKDLDLATCDGRRYVSWVNPSGGARFHQGPGQIDELLIVGDPTTGARLVIDQFWFPATPAEHVREIRSIADTLVVEVPPPVGPAPTPSSPAP